jgi:transposase
MKTRTHATKKATPAKPAAKRNPVAMRSRRLKAVKLFARGLAKAEVARRLGVSRQSVGRWIQQHADGGDKALQGAASLGRNPKVDAGTLKKFESELLKGPRAHGFANNLWTLRRMADVLKQTCGVSVHSRYVWHLMRALGWSPQRPQAKARERDEAAIRKWRRHTWSAIKKKPARKNGGSSSRMKAG